MITVVTTSKGNIRGYIIDTVYIKRDLLHYFTPVKTLRGVRVFGTPYNEDIKVRGKRYRT